MAYLKFAPGVSYVIEEDGRVFHMRPRRHQAKAPTQGVSRIETEEDPTAIWLSVAPTPKLERVVGSEWQTELDPGFDRFFTPPSVNAGQLVHREYRALRRSLGIPRRDIGAVDPSSLRERLHIGDGTEIEVKGGEHMDKRFAFLYAWIDDETVEVSNRQFLDALEVWQWGRGRRGSDRSRCGTEVSCRRLRGILSIAA